MGGGDQETAVDGLKAAFDLRILDWLTAEAYNTPA